MKLLILGGTRFLGRWLVAAALARGHTVTLFHRGKTNPGLFPECDHVHGDRDGGLDALGKASWDAVLDPSGYVPRIVGQSADLLRGRAGRYVFVSSISVYADVSQEGLTEEAPVVSLADPTVEGITGETYGGLKALCEEVVRQRFGDEALVIRPGLIVGPHDPSDRFTYWVVRMNRPGTVLVPADPLQPVQFIDVRDLAGWTIDQVEAGRAGTVHTTGPRFRWGFRDWLEAIRQTLSSEAEPVWAPPGILARPGVPPDTGLPFILPGDSRGLFAMDVGRAFRWGLSPRPMAETIRDTLAWFRAEHPDAPRLEECLKTRLPDGLEETLLAGLSSQPDGCR